MAHWLKSFRLGQTFPIASDAAFWRWHGTAHGTTLNTLHEGNVMFKAAHQFLDRLGGFVLSLLAVAFFLLGLACLWAFYLDPALGASRWPLGIGLLLASIACAVMRK